MFYYNRIDLGTLFDGKDITVEVDTVNFVLDSILKIVDVLNQRYGLHIDANDVYDNEFNPDAAGRPSSLFVLAVEYGYVYYGMLEIPLHYLD